MARAGSPMAVAIQPVLPSVAVVIRLAKGPAAQFAVFEIPAKSCVVVFSEYISIIYHAPNDIKFASCPKLYELRFLERDASVDWV